MIQICSDGFTGAAVPLSLSDSIMLADLPRLRHSSGRGQLGGRGQRSRDESKSELLLCKVFKGRHKEIGTSGM